MAVVLEAMLEVALAVAAGEERISLAGVDRDRGAAVVVVVEASRTEATSGEVGSVGNGCWY